jgi:hypothetical protein
MKVVIRIILVVASASMVLGNLHNPKVSLLAASSLFLAANLMSLIYNLFKGGSNEKR